MMMNLIAKRSTKLSSIRPLIGGFKLLDTVSHHHSPSSTSALVLDEIEQVLPFRRGFHAKSVPLEFRSSVAAHTEFAVADYGYDEEKKVVVGGKSSEGGLEIAKLGISEDIVSALAKKGITSLFPIQKAVLEPAMQGRDMFGRARTGTGKTLAFGIPIMNRIIEYNKKHGRGRYPLALVMAPTRELAKQVEREFHESAPVLDTICVYGGTPISQQMRELDHGVDVAVGTPGRIIDLLKRGALNLSEVQFVVLDEADQMLNVGFAEDVEVIMEKVPRKRQTLMFSATRPTWIRELVKKHMNNPLTIDLVGDSDQKLADGITLYSIPSDSYTKASVISPLITEHAKGGKCIVFTQTKRDADRLAYGMGKNLKCEALHGDISQSQRERTLSGFREGHFNVLVATDVAARGLDIPNVDLIIHYEIPNSSETFVHRTGRTGRAGKKGTAIVIYTHDQSKAVKLIERDVGCRFKELPKIAVEGGGDMFSNINMGGRFGDRRSGDSGFGGRSGGRGGDYGFGGRSGGGGFGRSDYGGSSSSRGGGGGGYGGSSSGRFGNFGGSSSDRGFGEFGKSDRSSRSSMFGDNQSSRSSGSFGGSRSSGGFGDFGSGRPSGFGDNKSTRRFSGLSSSSDWLIN